MLATAEHRHGDALRAALTGSTPRTTLRRRMATERVFHPVHRM